MRFHPPSDEAIIYETTFEHDVLGRSNLSRVLSGFVDNIKDPIVIALNGKWGTGKSYFLKRWVGAHSIQNGGRALTVYFDAFSNDYISDPLIGLTQAVTERVPPEEQANSKKIKTLAIGLARPALNAALSVLDAGISSVLNELATTAVHAITAETRTAVDKFWKQESGRKIALKTFLDTLKEMTVDEDGITRPIVVVIDELDRCRPDYALELLETIKHFFSVPNVHFVLGLNMQALEDMVRVRYGNGVSAGEYLRKFITIQFELPNEIGDQEKTPAVAEYIRVSSEKMDMPPHLRKELIDQVKVINRRKKISLRDANTIMSHLMIAPSEARGDNILSGWKDVFVTLTIAKVIDPVMYDKLHTVTFSQEDLITFFDATEERIKRLGDGWNSAFDHNTLVIYGLWLYLMGDGKLPVGTDFPPFERAFDSFRHGRVREIPSQIHYRWLNTYSIP